MSPIVEAEVGPTPDDPSVGGGSGAGTESPGPQPSIAGGTILNVNDDDANRYALGRILQRAGFRVREAVTGMEALRAVAESPPALIVLDVDLPDLNGFDVCRRLKDDPATRSIPVLQISAKFVREEDKSQGLYSGADGYLVQPVEPPELVSTVRSLLRLREAEEAARASARRVEQLEKELAALERLASHPASATARAYGSLSLSDAAPEAFRGLIAELERLMDLSMEQQQYKVEHDVSLLLRALGDRLGAYRAGPRDVIQLYGAALKGRTHGATAVKARAYIEEGRLMVLELMGHLVSYYRYTSVGEARQRPADPAGPEASAGSGHG